MPDIPLSDLIDPPVVLRTVDQRCVEYVELRDSLARVGFLNSICVRPSIKTPGKFEVVDGRQRVACATEINLTPIPCIVKLNLTDKDVLAAQITANAARLLTRPSEYARQIRRILHETDGLTLPELCQYINKNPTWVRKMLGVARLAMRKEYRNALDRGELSLEAAYYLSKLVPRQWAAYAMDAKTMPLNEFKALVMATLRQFRANVRLGTMQQNMTRYAEPHPYTRSMTDILAEAEDNRVGALMIASEEFTPLQAWTAALKWMVHLDKDSVERQRVRILNRMKRRNTGGKGIES